MVSEHYDELVFQDVHESFWRRLMVGGKLTDTSPAFEGERDQISAILKSHADVKEETRKLRDYYNGLDTESSLLRTQIERLERELAQLPAVE